MTYPTPEPVVSGVPYEVQDVAGNAPTDLTAFDGSTTVTVVGSTGVHVLRGSGSAHEDHARFYEKSEDGIGKDMRTWKITPADRGGFTAQTL